MKTRALSDRTLVITATFPLVRKHALSRLVSKLHTMKIRGEIKLQPRVV